MIAESSIVKELFPPRESLHLLTLTPFYPVQGDDGQGCFVAEPLTWLAKLGVTNTVRAARPFYREAQGRSGACLHDSGTMGALLLSSWWLGSLQFRGLSFCQPSS